MVETNRMRRRQGGFISFGSMTLVVGGCALAGLLLYGWRTGQELPLWPALAVAAVNIFGAVRLLGEHRKPPGKGNGDIRR